MVSHLVAPVNLPTDIQVMEGHCEDLIQVHIRATQETVPPARQASINMAPILPITSHRRGLIKMVVVGKGHIRRATLQCHLALAVPTQD